ncbi:MAG TPA: cupin domain-containing protein [Clostridia bacterium]|nr:cupin domain-containing protein [Clostridia bacterium]
METKYVFNQSQEKLIEKIIDSDEVMINHMIFNESEGLPRHASNSNVYMLVIRGTLSLKLGDKEEKKHPQGSLLSIAYNVMMDVSNKDREQVEIFVIKAPHPRNYKEL